MAVSVPYHCHFNFSHFEYYCLHILKADNINIFVSPVQFLYHQQLFCYLNRVSEQALYFLHCHIIRFLQQAFLRLRPFHGRSHGLNGRVTPVVLTVGFTDCPKQK